MKKGRAMFREQRWPEIAKFGLKHLILSLWRVHGWTNVKPRQPSVR